MKFNSLWILAGVVFAGMEVHAQCTPTLTNGFCRYTNEIEILPANFVSGSPNYTSPAFEALDPTCGLTVWGNSTTGQLSPVVAHFRALLDGDQSAAIEVRGSRGSYSTRTSMIRLSNWDKNPDIGKPEYTLQATVAGGRTNNAHQGYFAVETNDGTDSTSMVQGLFMDHLQNVGLGGSGTFNVSNLPSQRLDVDGQARIRTINETDEYDYILVTDETGLVQKIGSDALSGGTDLDWVVAGTSSTLATSLSNNIRTDGMVGIGMNPTSTINYGSGTISNVKLAVNGAIFCTAIATSSDARLKTGIQPITGALDKVKNLGGYSYNFINDHGTELELPDAPQVGVLAQEVQAMVPEAVSELENGYLAVNYDMLIPVLIESIKELSAELDEMKAALAMSTPELTGDAGNRISQNFPNPTSGMTSFSIDLKEDVQSAGIIISDLTGKTIDEFSLTDRGSFDVNYDTVALEGGIYIYTFVVNGRIADSKRMVVSK